MIQNAFLPTTAAGSNDTAVAFEYLKQLESNQYKVLKDESAPINMNLAKDFTDTFRTTSDAFTIPVSWSLDKEALIKLLGITAYSGYSGITGVRLYAGLNGDNQLTLIAVSTEADASNALVQNDLTQEDQYPYYDYAAPCPSHCSSVGNLRLMSSVSMTFKRHQE